ncbi:hypothetical protein AN963_12050 [Brevibacillus choshinensis]|uniref:Lipoprotein n=1 Tax=Brevibacillus choshinensis TaxID=54911 RepID=A0ABR5N559_BRECH|nr:hypothetical protein [Brevibacillus choshinensis]KQL45772.1 hypothetical protein AN963_12050 [Brevibacillus choshinensis]
MRKGIHLVALLMTMLLQACSSDTDIGASNPTIHEKEKEKSVPTVEAKVEHFLSSDDISIFVQKKEGKPNELVIYSSLPPRGQELERKILALRIVNQVVRDYPNTTFFSIWDDKEAAGVIAANGDRESSWDGYLHQVAFAIKNAKGVRVSYALSMDDFENISFGMSPVD